ncbi:hypothetical protein NDU88_001466 [Pleurodeles waltl]|uniref:Uncharacterized protein n=1 Tax=Pleurodeles waltl TaxID=8319 RepID=A0AAV7KSQ8_PLEWA|nr:hypothetical protein NDU88_001466 [Pleurodeles waltl]
MKREARTWSPLPSVDGGGRRDRGVRAKYRRHTHASRVQQRKPRTYGAESDERIRVLGEPSAARRPWGEEKAGPRAASEISSLEKVGAWPGQVQDAFLEPGEGRGCAPTSVVASKRQRLGATECNRGLNVAPRRKPQEKSAWLQ